MDPGAAEDEALNAGYANGLRAAATIAEQTGPTSDPRWAHASAEQHMWRNTHWQEAQQAIAAAIRARIVG